MKVCEVAEIFKNDSKGNKYAILTYSMVRKDGKRKQIRLCTSKGGYVSIMARKSKTMCYNLVDVPYEVDKWKSIKLVETWCDLKLFKKHIGDAIKYLSESGFWGDILADLSHFFSLGDNVLEDYLNMVKEDTYKAYCNIVDGDGKFYGMTRQYAVLESLANRKCWASIAWTSSWRKSSFEDAAKNKQDFYHSWTKWYDNSIEMRNCDDGIFRAWYSEEYRGCGNGYYYLLFDGKHAIFNEKD